MHGFSIHRVERMNYLLGGLLVAATALLGSREHMLGALVGALVSAVNFSLISRIVRRMGSAPAPGQNTAALMLVPKMLGVMGAITLAILFVPLSAVMLAVGFSIFLVSIGIETVRFALTAHSEPGAGAVDEKQSED
jgi:hypothetical protein